MRDKLLCGLGGIMDKTISVTQQIETTCETICDNFCKYRDTCDKNCECDWIRSGNVCPLDALY